MITADTITDEQIRALMHDVSRFAGIGASDRVFRDCSAALAPGVGREGVRAAARARCAEILNTRTKVVP